MKKSINVAYIYILLWAIYYMQGVLYAEGSNISRMMMLCIMVMSLYYWLYANIRYKLPVYFKGANILLAVITIYGLFRLNQGSILVGDKVVSNYTYLKDHYMSLLPIYAFFVFSKKAWIRKDNLKILLVIFFILSIVFYFRLRHEYYTLLEIDEFTNNSGYMFVQLFPLLYLCDWKALFKFAWALVLFLVIILTMKRGAILIGTICFAYFLFEVVKRSSKNRRLALVGVSILVAIIGARFTINLYNSDEYFQMRVEETLEGDSSGRSHIYSDLRNHYLHETTTKEFILGSGADSSVKIAGNYAHNDWLELATCLGLVGLLTYLFYWITFAKNLKMCRVNPYRDALRMVFFILFVRTFFSMSVNDIFIACSCALGYTLANYNSESKVLE